MRREAPRRKVYQVDDEYSSRTSKPQGQSDIAGHKINGAQLFIPTQNDPNA
jgi:ABC-type tungstate transport system permease subunit